MSNVADAISGIGNVVQDTLRHAPKELRADAEEWVAILANAARDVASGSMTTERYQLMLNQAAATMALKGANQLAATEKRLLDGLLDAVIKVAVTAL